MQDVFVFIYVFVFLFVFIFVFVSADDGHNWRKMSRGFHLLLDSTLSGFLTPIQHPSFSMGSASLDHLSPVSSHFNGLSTIFNETRCLGGRVAHPDAWFLAISVKNL